MDRIELDTLRAREMLNVCTTMGSLVLVKTSVETDIWAKLRRVSDNVEVHGNGKPVNLTRHLFVITGVDGVYVPRRLPLVLEADAALL